MDPGKGPYDPNKILKLCVTLNNPSLSSKDIQREINKYLVEETSSFVSFLLPVPSLERKEEDDDVAIGHTEEFYYIYVIGLEERSPPIKFESNQFVFSPSTSYLTFEELSPRQIQYLESILRKEISSFLAVPICASRPSESSNGFNNNFKDSSDPEDGRRPLWIACLANKNGAYGENEVQIIKKCFEVTLNILQTKTEYEEEKRLKNQCQSLLTVARKLFTHLDDVSVLLRQIMTEARHLTQAEKCSLFLVDAKNQELHAKVFDGDIPDKAQNIENGKEVRIPLKQGIAGHVALTGEILNIRDAQKHPLFYDGIDKNTGFKTKNILCFPIKDESQVIGVAELCNKNPGHFFTQFDEEIAKAFSAYCGLSIMHSLMYKKVADAQHRSKLSNELMMYHMKVADEDVFRLANEKSVSPKEIYPDFALFSFSPRTIESHKTSAVVMEMFKDCGMIHRWRIPTDTLARFILMVKRGYRDPPYHNWMHAFSVAHFAYLLITNGGLIKKNFLTELEGLALLVACLCHDLDHRGTNNSFQVASNSVLAALYSSEGSVMERHHFAQTMCILNTEGCNILENLDDKDYTLCLDLLRDIILATDLAHHLRIEEDIRRMLKNGYHPDNAEHHFLMTSMLMTACDLADQTKNWENSKHIAELVYSEFFSQGDLEKAMGNKPVPMMDRERACIPTLQIEFIDGIALPIYELLNSFFPETKNAYESVQLNRQCWIKANEALTKRGRNGTGNVKDIFRDSEIEEEVLEAIKEKKMA